MNKIETQLKKGTNFSMTKKERDLLRSNIFSYMNQYNQEPKIQNIKSPFYAHTLWRPTLATVFSFMILITGWSTLSYGASDALPGDNLYSLKIKNEQIQEQVQGILLISKKEKMLRQQYLVAKRIDEIKQLVASNTLTPEKAAIAEKAIETHIEKIDEVAHILAEENPKEFAETTAELAPLIATQEKDLLEITKTQEEKLNPEIVIPKDKTIKVESVDNKTSDTVPPTPETKPTQVETSTLEQVAVNPTPTKTTLVPLAKPDVSPEVATVGNIINKIQQSATSLETLKKPTEDQQIKNSTDTIDKAPEINTELQATIQ